MKIKIYKDEAKDFERLTKLADSLNNGFYALQYNDYSDPHYGSKIIKVMKHNQDEVQEIYKRHPRLSEVMVVILKHDDVELEFKRNEKSQGGPEQIASTSEEEISAYKQGTRDRKPSKEAKEIQSEEVGK